MWINVQIDHAVGARDYEMLCVLCMWQSRAFGRFQLETLKCKTRQLLIKRVFLTSGRLVLSRGDGVVCRREYRHLSSTPQRASSIDSMSSDDSPLPCPPPTCAFCRWTRALTGARVVVVKMVVGGGGAPCPHHPESAAQPCGLFRNSGRSCAARSRLIRTQSLHLSLIGPVTCRGQVM